MKLVLKILGIVIVLLVVTVWILVRQGVIVKQREIKIVNIDCSKKDSLFEIIEKRTLNRNSVDFKTMVENDYLNAELTISFIKSCGNPKIENISNKEASYIFLSIQHSPNEEILEEYINVINQMVQDSFLDGSTFAFMKDKILVNDNEPQHYGTQFSSKRKLLEVDNLDSVNIRRRSLGMESLEDYMKKNNIVY